MDPDETLPALEPGNYRFLVHKFDVVSPTLMAIEPLRGKLQVLLPESKTWMSLEQASGENLAEGLKNFRGWRMEVVEGTRRATLYLPTARGLAMVTPSLVDLSYAVEYVGDGPALGGPVAWSGEVWLPVLGKSGAVSLVGKPKGVAPPIVLRTGAPVPRNGFEAPVLDSLHVNWPSDEGQLLVRLDQGNKLETDWVPWPDGLRPMFSLGCPYLSPAGTFWQPCWSGSTPLHGSHAYVPMGKPAPEQIAVDGPRPGTGHVSYQRARRIEGDPWSQPEHAAGGKSSEIFLPLIESEFERAVVGMRIDAPQGILALLESHTQQHSVVLQLHSENRPEVAFGVLSITRPWLASVFVYDAHLWVYHPELSQALGWKLS